MSGREVTGFALHREPVWRERANYIINAPIGDSAHTHTEQLWVRQDMASRLYEICCIPFFLYDVALGDLVSVRRARVRVERYSARLVAVDICADDSPQRLADYLAQAQMDGRLVYETGRSE